MAAAATRTGSGPRPAPAAPDAPHGQLRAERSFERIPSLGGSSPRSSPRASASAVKSCALGVVEPGRGVHLHMDEEVTAAAATQLGHAQALER